MKYRQLQKELKRLGLKSHGTKDALEARLADYMKEKTGIDAVNPSLIEDSPAEKYFETNKDYREFVFTGDPNAPGQDPAYISMYGYLFTLNGRAVTVAPEHAAKLATSSHFTEA
jgi:hypothetical protein